MNENQKPILLQDLGMLFPKENSNKKKRYGIYKCYCGNEFKAPSYSINIGKTKSCGCLQRQTITNRNILNATHNLTRHRLYKTWNNMIRRCSNSKNKDYKHYGERGITVCNEWLDINNFINDMYPTYKEGLTLDRENHLGNYEKSNCRWTTKNIQSQNTKKIRINNTSGYRGVHWHKRLNKWNAKISVNKKDIHLGYFDTALESAQIYDKYIIDNSLEHTKNFS